MKIMIDTKNVDVEAMTAYIPSLLSELRSETNWSVKQIKLFVYILSQFYQHKILIPKDNYSKDKLEAIDLENINRRIKISKETIISVTDIPRSQFARDIRKTTYGMKASVATIPSSLEPNEKSSYIHRSWFEEFEYIDSQGVVSCEIDKKIFPYLIIFCNYTRIKLSHVMKFQNNYTFDTYILLKMKLNRYKKKSSIEIDLQSFKEKINMKNSYNTNFAMFKKSVLNKVTQEINDNTDIELTIENIKTGKKVTHLLLEFSLKPEMNIQLEQSENKSTPIELENKAERNTININTLQNTLNSYGVRTKNANILISEYGEAAVRKGVELLNEEINNGKEIKNIPGYLISIIKNNIMIPSTEDIAIRNENKKNDKRLQDLAFEENWIMIENFLKENNSILEELYQTYKNGKYLLDQKHIEFQENLKILVSMNPELIEMKRPFLHSCVDFGKTSINMRILEELSSDLKIGKIEDRKPYITKAIKEKTKLLADAVTEIDKEMYTEELKNLIDLI
jgi:plasmid replication initiation protein